MPRLLSKEGTGNRFKGNPRSQRRDKPGYGFNSSDSGHRLRELLGDTETLSSLSSRISPREDLRNELAGSWLPFASVCSDGVINSPRVPFLIIARRSTLLGNLSSSAHLPRRASRSKLSLSEEDRRSDPIVGRLKSPFNFNAGRARVSQKARKPNCSIQQCLKVNISVGRLIVKTARCKKRKLVTLKSFEYREVLLESISRRASAKRNNNGASVIVNYQSRVCDFVKSHDESIIRVLCDHCEIGHRLRILIIPFPHFQCDDYAFRSIKCEKINRL